NISAGIVHDASFVVVPSWQAWKCLSLHHRLMIIESMDTDTEALVGTWTSSMDRWTEAGVLATWMTYEMAMTSMPLQELHL
ncbi:hypothetical protein O3P69_012553, partial [Scylla paramamosain]